MAQKATKRPIIAESDTFHRISLQCPTCSLTFFAMDKIGITEEMADWTDLDLWGQSIIECVTEELITGWEAMEFSYGGSMILKDTDPLTGEQWEETALLCDTSLDRLEWLENTVEGKAFHKRLQTILEQPVFFRNKEKSI